MNIEKRIAVSLLCIKEMIDKGSPEEASKHVQMLWKVVGRLGRNNEAIHCGVSLHGAKVIHEAKMENRIILGSDQLLHEIILAK